jgi:hypothetical protein
MYRKLLLLPFVAAFPIMLSGCGASQAEIEKTVREGMEEKLHTKVTSLTMSKTSDTKYNGTAVATNGTTYDVTATIDGKMVRWEAVPNQASMEKMVTQLVQERLKISVKTLTLTKGPGNTFHGTAESTTGAKLDIAGTPPVGGMGEYQWKIIPDQAGTEKEFRQLIARNWKQGIQSIVVKKQADGMYTGTGTLADGQKLKLRTFWRDNKLMYEAKP